MGKKYKIVRRFSFDAAHRLVNHTGKCRHLHGHTYGVEVHAIPRPKIEGLTSNLDSMGMVIDFAVIKERVGTFIDNCLDHNTILSKADIGLIPLVQAYCKGGQPFLMDVNPTAENIGAMLLAKAQELLADTPVIITKVIVQETPNCRAEVECTQ